VKFDAQPAIPIATVKKEVGKYKVDKIALKLTGKATEKDKAWYMGAITLTGDMTSKVAELKGKVIVVTGILSDDEKTNKQSLAVASVEEPKKK